MVYGNLRPKRDTFVYDGSIKMTIMEYQLFECLNFTLLLIYIFYQIFSGDDEVLKRLQNLVGERPTITIHNFTNWGKTEFTHGVYLAEPESLLEIQRLVKAAGSLKLRMRSVGTAFSWSPLFADQGDILIKTTSLKTSHDRPNMVINKPVSTPKHTQLYNQRLEQHR